MTINKIIPLSLFIMTLALVGCTFDKNAEAVESTIVTNDKDDVEILRFPKIGEDTLKTSFFADTVLYVPLETTTKSFLKRIKQVWMNDSIILIDDFSKLLMFSRTGKFVRQIGKQGKGPGEYQIIFDFEVIRDTIYLSSTGKKSLIKYTLDGTFCEEISLGRQPVFFSSTNNEKFVEYDLPEGKVYFYNEDFSKTDTIVVEYGVTLGRYKYSSIDWSFMTYFQKTSSRLLFNDYLSDTVWDISNAQKTPAFILDMKDQLLPRNKHIEFSGGDFNKWEKTAKLYQMMHLVPFSSRMFIFQQHWSEDEYSSIYHQDRRTSEMKKYNSSFVYDDIESHQKLPKFIFTSSPDYLVAQMESWELKENLGSNNENIQRKASPTWLNQMKSVDKNDNPILVLIKVKNEL